MGDLLKCESLYIKYNITLVIYTVHLRTNLDRTKMEHRWKQHKKRKAHKKISFRNVALYEIK